MDWRMREWLNDWMTEWLSDWMIECENEWLTEWLNVRMIEWIGALGCWRISLFSFYYTERHRGSTEFHRGFLCVLCEFFVALCGIVFLLYRETRRLMENGGWLNDWMREWMNDWMREWMIQFNTQKKQTISSQVS